MGRAFQKRNLCLVMGIGVCVCVCVHAHTHVCTHACVALTNQNREALTNHNGLWVCAGAGSWKSFAVRSQIVWLWNGGKIEYILRKRLLAQVINDLQHCPGRKMKDGVVSLQGQILANGVALEEMEVAAKNGRIYTLTGVLIPPSIIPILPHRCDETKREMRLVRKLGNSIRGP